MLMQPQFNDSTRLLLLLRTTTSAERREDMQKASTEGWSNCCPSPHPQSLPTSHAMISSASTQTILVELSHTNFLLQISAISYWREEKKRFSLFVNSKLNFAIRIVVVVLRWWWWCAWEKDSRRLLWSSWMQPVTKSERRYSELYTQETVVECVCVCVY